MHPMAGARSQIAAWCARRKLSRIGGGGEIQRVLDAELREGSRLLLAPAQGGFEDVCLGHQDREILFRYARYRVGIECGVRLVKRLIAVPGRQKIALLGVTREPDVEHPVEDVARVGPQVMGFVEHGAVGFHQMLEGQPCMIAVQEANPVGLVFLVCSKLDLGFRRDFEHDGDRDAVGLAQIFLEEGVMLEREEAAGGDKPHIVGKTCLLEGGFEAIIVDRVGRAARADDHDIQALFGRIATEFGYDLINMGRADETQAPSGHIGQTHKSDESDDGAGEQLERLGLRRQPGAQNLDRHQTYGAEQENGLYIAQDLDLVAGVRVAYPITPIDG